MGNGGILMVQKQFINNGIKQVTYCFLIVMPHLQYASLLYKARCCSVELM